MIDQGHRAPRTRIHFCDLLQHLINLVSIHREVEKIPVALALCTAATVPHRRGAMSGKEGSSVGSPGRPGDGDVVSAAPGMMDSVVSIATSVGEEQAPPSTGFGAHTSTHHNSDGTTHTGGGSYADPTARGNSGGSAMHSDDDPPDTPTPAGCASDSGASGGAAAPRDEGQVPLSITEFRPVPFTSSNFVRPLTLLYKQGSIPRRYVARLWLPPPHAPDVPPSALPRRPLLVQLGHRPSPRRMRRSAL